MTTSAAWAAERIGTPIDAEVAAWNAALASGDAERIATVQRATLDAIHARIMADDRYQARTH